MFSLAEEIELIHLDWERGALRAVRERCRSLIGRVEEPFRKAELSFYLGRVELLLDQPGDALLSLRIAKAYQKEKGVPSGVAQLLLLEADCHYRLGENIAAKDCLREACDVCPSLHDDPLLSFQYLSLLGYGGELRLAHELLMRWEESALETESLKAAYFVCLGQMCRQMGGFRDGLVAFRRAAKAFGLEGGGPLDEVKCWLSMGACCQGMAQYQEALHWYESARRYLLDGRDGPAELEEVNKRLGEVYRALNDEELVHSLVYPRDDLVGGTKEEVDEAFASLFQSYQDAFQAGRYTDAVGLLYGAIQEASKEGRRYTCATLFLHMGEAHTQEAAIDEALVAYQKAEAFARQAGAEELIWRSLRGQAECVFVQRDVHLATRLLEEACFVLEKIRSPLRSEPLRKSFMRDKFTLHGELFRLYLHINDTTSAFRTSERATARLLLDQLEEQRLLHPVASERVDQTLVQEYKEKLSQCKAALFQIALEKQRAVTEEGFREQARRYQRKAKERDLLLKKMALSGASTSRVAGVIPVGIEELQGELHSGQRLLRFFTDEGKIWRFLISDEACRVELLSTATHELEGAWSRYERLREMLARTAPEKRGDSAAGREQLEHSQCIYEMLLGGLEDELAKVGGKELFVVPCGPVHGIPLHALFDPEGNPLIQKVPVSYQLSCSTWLLLTKNAKAKQRKWDRLSFIGCSKPLALGGFASHSLPGVHEELRFIKTLFWWTRARLDGATLDQDLVQMSRLFSLLHIAGHAQFNPADPNASGIFLGGQKLFQLDEISRLRFPWLKHITLSACSGGAGHLSEGDQLNGMISALLQTGASSVLCAFWPILDEVTAHFMGEFYTQLLTERRDVAFQKATLSIYHHPEWGHPFHWSPFALFGAGEPLFGRGGLRHWIRSMWKRKQRASRCTQEED